jgi:hypothetical protein
MRTPREYLSTEDRRLRLRIEELLKNSLIQSSTSPFASPVLLVKKKDDPKRRILECLRNTPDGDFALFLPIFRAAVSKTEALLASINRSEAIPSGRDDSRDEQIVFSPTYL